MSDPKIVASARDTGRRALVQTDSSGAWAVLGWIGLVFVIVGGTDFAFVWFPTSFGAAEWEFATVTTSFNGLPIVLLGLGLLVVAGEQIERGWWVKTGAAGLLLLLVWVLLGLGLWSLNVSAALSTVPDELRLGILKAIAKTAIQGAAYPVVMGYLLHRVWLDWSSSKAQAS